MRYKYNKNNNLKMENNLEIENEKNNLGIENKED